MGSIAKIQKQETQLASSQGGDPFWEDDTQTIASPHISMISLEVQLPGVGGELHLSSAIRSCVMAYIRPQPHPHTHTHTHTHTHPETKSQIFLGEGGRTFGTESAFHQLPIQRQAEL